MMIYKLTLFLFVVGIVMGGMNAMNVFTSELPKNTIVVSDIYVENMTTVQDAESTSPWNYLTTFASILMGGFAAAVCIGVYMVYLHIPWMIAAMVEAPVLLLQVVGFFELLTGRDVE